MSSIRIRTATEASLPALVRLYNHYVTNTHITFDVSPLKAQERRGWFGGFSTTGPHRLLMAEDGGRPVGYASSSPFRPKPAYHRSVETTIYLDPGAAGRGIGLLLYGALLEALEAEPLAHRAYAGIALPNPGSIALHERLGFRLAGTFREVGFKFGQYWDVNWYEKDLSGDGQGEAR